MVWADNRIAKVGIILLPMDLLETRIITGYYNVWQHMNPFSLTFTLPITA